MSNTLLKRFEMYQQDSFSVHQIIDQLYTDLCSEASSLTETKSLGIFGLSSTSGIPGTTLISWMMKNKESPLDETQSLTYAQHLLDGGYMYPGSTFDPQVLYTLIQTDSQSVAGLLRVEGGRKQGEMCMPRKFSSKKVHVLCTSKTLGVYESEYALTPLHCLTLEDVKLEDDPSNLFGLMVAPKSPHAIKLTAENMSMKNEWIEALVGAGVEYGKHTKITSLFDLKDRWMNGQVAPMAEYRGKVCLIVNVASF